MYPHTADVLAATGLHPLRHYIIKRRHTIWKFVRSRPILKECMGAERREGTHRRLNWWHQTMDYTGEEEWVYPHTADVLAAAGLQPLRHYIDKRRNTIWKSVRGRPILEECMGAERRGGTPRRLNWWHQTMDYTGEGVGKEAGSTGRSDGLALPARSPPATPPPPARRVPAPAPPRREPMPRTSAAEQEALDALWQAAHFHD